MEISKFLTLSTAHISPETAAALDADALPFTVWRAEYGYFIYARHAIPNDGDSVESCMSEPIALDDIPHDLRACMNTANGAGCDWLRLDCDGDKLDGLAVYDWQ